MKEVSMIYKDITVLDFARKFIAGKLNWLHCPRLGLTHFGNIISQVIFRDIPFQVELFIVPSAPSSFTEHTHPDVDVVEYPLSGVNVLYVNGKEAHTVLQAEGWLAGELPSPLVRIEPTDKHSGQSDMLYSFLSIQKWLNGVAPTSVGLNWMGEPSSSEQAQMLYNKTVQ